jgi:hypothetical protein
MTDADTNNNVGKRIVPAVRNVSDQVFSLAQAGVPELADVQRVQVVVWARQWWPTLSPARHILSSVTFSPAMRNTVMETVYAFIYQCTASLDASLKNATQGLMRVLTEEMAERPLPLVRGVLRVLGPSHPRSPCARECFVTSFDLETPSASGCRCLAAWLL